MTAIEPGFERARRKATWHRIVSFLTRRPYLLLPFDLVRSRIQVKSVSYEGIREIELSKIVGSVNRYHDFDREFLPRDWSSAERWSRVRQTFDGQKGFDPIKVYRMGDAYFVVDGNHRVSVARQLGMKKIEAEITQFQPDVPIDEHTDLSSLMMKSEYSDFLKRTRLDELRPEQRIEFSRPGGYADLLEHIEKHRYYIGQNEHRWVPYEEAVGSWYDHLYRPLVEIFRQERILALFPGRTEADLYVWVTRHLYYLREHFGDDLDLDTAAIDFAETQRSSSVARFLKGLWSREDLGGRAYEDGVEPMHALHALEARLRELRLSTGREARPAYRVPRMWMEPEGDGVVTTDPVTFWLSAAHRILHEPPRACPRGSSGEWTRSGVIYNLFVRASLAFDHDGDGRIASSAEEMVRETGTFMKAIALLPYIRDLGCDIVHLLPIGSIGHDGRKGVLGSPYALQDPYVLDDKLAEPMIGLGADIEFRAFVESAHRLGIRVVVEFVFRTGSKDSAWIPEHPEWFYWIREDVPDRSARDSSDTGYGSPRFAPAVLDEIKRRVAQGDFRSLPAPSAAFRALFLPPPRPEDVREEHGRYVGMTAAGDRARIPGAFADWPPDDTQPPWDDVTYLRMYDHPDFNYMAYNTVRMYDAHLAAEEHQIDALWDRIVGILPHYQREYGIDGTMVDMGHALPLPLKRRIIAAARAADPDFAFWDEDFSLQEDTRREGYNAAIGNLWWMIHRPEALRSEWLPELARRGPALPFFATPETHNTPRSASRSGGVRRSNFCWIFGCFLPAIPFIHSGFELGEVVPVNTGLDFRPEEAAAFPAAMLPLYSPSAYRWDAGARDIAPTIRSALSLRRQYLDLVVDATVLTLRIPGIVEGSVVAYERRKGEQWILVVGNPTDSPTIACLNGVGMRDQEMVDRMTAHRCRIDGGLLRTELPPWTCLVFTSQPAAADGGGR